MFICLDGTISVYFYIFTNIIISIFIFLMISSTWNKTRKLQINNSSSKQTYPFPKEKRFTSTMPKNLCDSFYQIPSMFKTGKYQGTSLGKGNKSKIIGNVDTPSPNKYELKGVFEGRDKGISMSKGRDSFKNGGIFKKSDTPEPGHYKINNSLDTHRGFTIYSKLQQSKPSYAKNPGPAHYMSANALQMSGRCVLSSNKNTPSYKIKPMKQPNPFHNITKPGPGQYDNDKENINNRGQYYNSKFSNSRCRIFSKTAKKGLVSSRNIPGVGSYNHYSEFGRSK